MPKLEIGILKDEPKAMKKDYDSRGYYIESAKQILDWAVDAYDVTSETGMHSVKKEIQDVINRLQMFVDSVRGD